MSNIEKGKLYKAFGVLWMVVTNDRGTSFIGEKALCPNDSCRATLQRKNVDCWYCVKCIKEYSHQTDYYTDHDSANRMWEGYEKLDWDVYSLDLPPTKVVGEDEDENYWVKAKISEQGGKRMAVVYFGEKVREEQGKSDYSQLFLDLEDEQLRFDRGNKNPMNILCKLTAEFRDSIIKQEKKK